jgi:6-pyruvoyltetrahydropterin/6-carboxytetrahydropterin synthase
MFEVTVEQAFSAAHSLREYPGKCANVHGHNYKVEITVAGPALDKLGMLVEFETIKRALAPWIEKFDHGFLNELAPFDALNPTAENLAKFFHDVVAAAIAAEIAKQPEEAAVAKVICVRVRETDKCSAVYRP